MPAGTCSAPDVVPGQQRLDVRARGERGDDLAEDIHVCAEVLEDLFQVLLLFVGALEVCLLVLLGNDEHVHHEAVSHSVEDALADCLLQAIQAARQVLDFNGSVASQQPRRDKRFLDLR